MKTINKAGFDLIREFEGLKLKAYLCPAGVPTIGYGSTGPDIRLGMTWTVEQADERLASDLRKFEQDVARLCPVTNDNQFSALVAFAYNCGTGNLQSSTLRKMHNLNDYEGAAEQFARWNKGGGKVLPGLVRRRAAEAALYRSA